MPIIRLTSLKSVTIVALISILFSTWVYWGSDFKLKQLLMSREWQSRIVTLIEQDLAESSNVKDLRRVDVNSNVKYLPNHTYIRVSVLKVYSQGKGKEAGSSIDISESGTWALSDGYLLISPTEFKDVSANQSKDFTKDQLDIVTQFFKMDAQQSRRIDVIDRNTLLLISLNHDSVTLFSPNIP
jgi:transmembrane regulatory protein ToxS